jgi:hypothetical protein
MVLKMLRGPKPGFWTQGVGNQRFIQQGKFLLNLDLDADKKWRYQIFRNGKQIGQSRASGYNRMKTAQVQAVNDLKFYMEESQ